MHFSLPLLPQRDFRTVPAAAMDGSPALLKMWTALLGGDGPDARLGVLPLTAAEVRLSAALERRVPTREGVAKVWHRLSPEQRQILMADLVSAAAARAGAAPAAPRRRSVRIVPPSPAPLRASHAPRRPPGPPCTTVKFAVLRIPVASKVVDAAETLKYIATTAPRGSVLRGYVARSLRRLKALSPYLHVRQTVIEVLWDADLYDEREAAAPRLLSAPRPLDRAQLKLLDRSHARDARADRPPRFFDGL